MFVVFKLLYFVGFLFLYGIISVLMTIAALPSFYLIRSSWQPSEPAFSLFMVFLGLMLAMTLLMFVFALSIRLINMLFRLREGSSSVYGTQMIIWSVQYVFMNFMNTFFLPVLRTTPLINLFYRLMGAKIGANVFFNSSFIYEPQFIEIGNNSRIGENAVIAPHTTEGSQFICAKITIGKNVTIGQYCQILPGATIGDNVIIAAGAIVPKNKLIEANTIYGGNPLKLIKHRQIN